MTTKMFKISRLQSKLETYDRQLKYLTEWCSENQELGSKITKAIYENTDNLDFKSLKLITQYHIEISKIIYATIALLDKIYKQKERLEKWQQDLEEV